MKRFQLVFLTVAFCFSAAAACFANETLMGTWMLKGSKSDFAFGMSRTTKLTYAPMGDKVKITFEGVDQNAQPTQGVWVGRFDGQVYPVKGNLPYDGLSYKSLNDRAQAVSAMKGGKLLWTGKITVSRNGRSRVVTMVGKDEKGKKIKSKAVYERVLTDGAQSR